MEWRDTGILLSSRLHGETSAILEVFTPAHGRHLGVLRGGASRKVSAWLQPGAQLDLAWRARLEDHIGVFTAEPQRSRVAQALGDRMALAGLNAVLSLLRFCLPERETHAALYQRTEALLDLMGQGELWPLAYLRWELALLEDMGFGLDLTCCAVTGATEGLAHVSPRSGRAVTAAAAGTWVDKLLPLPPVLLGQGEADTAEIVRALGTTGWFLENRLASDLKNKPLPDARAAYVARLSRVPAR